ncbi:MAG: transport between ER and Golgi ATPase protein [Chaenotheca gracillima]|nr:MAG: transport between ER and Golgi ATPase protein [Chaenotheca gracillima]
MTLTISYGGIEPPRLLHLKHSVGNFSIVSSSYLLAGLAPFFGGAQVALSSPPTLAASVTQGFTNTPTTSYQPVVTSVGTLHETLVEVQSSSSPAPVQYRSSEDQYESCIEYSLSSALSNSMRVTKRAVFAVLSTLSEYVTPSYYDHSSIPNGQRMAGQHLKNVNWTTDSSSWLDRKACRWLSICRACHFQPASAKFRFRTQDQPLNDQTAGFQSAWAEGKSQPEDWSDDERVLREIPQYVLDHAPLVHLFSDEQFWPCDIEDHLQHTTPHLNYTSLQSRSRHPTLTNLDQLNRWNRGRFVFLQSDDNVEERPEWLGGQKNIPSVPKVPKDPNLADDEASENNIDREEWDGRIDSDLPNGDRNGRGGSHNAAEGVTEDGGGINSITNAEFDSASTISTEGERVLEDNQGRFSAGAQGKQVRGGKSDAPAVLIVVDKGKGIVDAFWFYFYSFNLGNVVLNVRFGNHIGDWEHSMVRFQHGVPKAVYFSEHNFGDAYSYEAVEKIGKRPVVYSATGTHAMYATAGIHQYILPWGLLRDVTDRGPLWDPALNSHMYTYDHLSDNLRSSNVTPHAPVEWFYFAGHWGDKFYPLSDPRQYQFAGEYHYVNGPIGPRFKDLGRKNVCQGNGRCNIRNWIYEPGRQRRWVGVGEGEELSEQDFERVVPLGQQEDE